MFGTAFYILNLGRVGTDESVVPDVSSIWILDAFINQYELGLGEFQIDSYRESKGHQSFFIYTLFIISTFLIQITFLNMLIAIMGDAFERATEERENNARLTKLKIMGDYIDLIDKSDDIVPSEKTTKERMKQYYSSDHLSISGTDILNDSRMCDSNLTMGYNELFLYVVEVDENVNDKASWEGQL